jgi:hypothetical protein
MSKKYPAKVKKKQKGKTRILPLTSNIFSNLYHILQEEGKGKM